mgnify:CR=1 FL=1
MSITTLSKGQQRVRIGRNFYDNIDSAKVKEAIAEFIDRLETYRPKRDAAETYPGQTGEHHRLISEAQTKLEDACDQTVKALTEVTE